MQGNPYIHNTQKSIYFYHKMELNEYQKKRISQVRDELINDKMDEDWNLLREDAEKMVDTLRKSLKTFWLDLHCIKL